MKVIQDIQRQDNGFILIDALVAMVILSLAVLAIASASMGATKLSSVNDDQTQAYKLAQQSMEKLKLIPPSTWNTLISTSMTTYQTLNPTITANNIHINLPTTYTDTNSGITFTCTNFAKISTAANTGNHLVQVLVQVTWADHHANATQQNITIELMGYCERNDP